jgi:alpha-D-ribose 1-methylphosphonate 5-phosphate C-P lyase
MGEKIKYFFCKEKQIRAVNSAVTANISIPGEEIPFSTRYYKISDFPYHRMYN